MNKELINKFLKITLGILFLFSAISKIVAPGLFEITILEQGIIQSREVAAYFGRLIIVLELFLGLAFFQPCYLKKLILPLSLLTLIGFTGLLSYSFLIGDTSNCGCFGEVLKMSPLEAIVKNIVLIIIGLFSFNLEETKSKNIYIPALLFFISIVIVLGVAPIKSYENLKFSKYTDFENEGRVDLTSDDKLVAIFFINCEHCIATAKEIVTLENESDKLKNFYILFAGEETDSVKHFLNEINIDHPYQRIPIEDFFNLIGTAPPRIYWLQNGKVKEYWDDNFIKNLSNYMKER